jgi:uncharacterized alpha-E superfamily protein
MENEEIIKLTEVDARSRSNSHQIEEIKEEIKDIKNEQKAIYELTSSVKLIAQDMSSIKDSVNDVKQGQKILENKMDEQITDVKQKIEKVDEKSKVDFLSYIKEKILPFALGGGCIYGVIEFLKFIIK